MIARVAIDGASEIATPLVKLIVALPLAAGFAALVARTSMGPEKNDDGAPYTTEFGRAPGDRVPTLAFPLVIPFTSHVTSVFAVPDTCAENTCVFPKPIVASAGETITDTDGGEVTVTTAAADLLGSATLCAVTVTFSAAAGVCGAVYSPLPEIVPNDVFPPAIPFTNHVTEETGRPALEIVLENCCVPPGCTVAKPGEIETATSLVTVIEADALLVGSLTLVAAIVSLDGGST